MRLCSTARETKSRNDVPLIEPSHVRIRVNAGVPRTIALDAGQRASMAQIVWKMRADGLT